MPFAVSRATPESLDYVFGELGPMLERALRHGAGDSTTLEHIREAVRQGHMILWVVHDGPEIWAGVILSVYDYPKKRTVFVEVIGGRDLDVWAEHVEGLLREYRDLVNADTIEASCRFGLAKRLSGRWRRKAVLMELK